MSGKMVKMFYFELLVFFLFVFIPGKGKTENSKYVR